MSSSGEPVGATGSEKGSAAEEKEAVVNNDASNATATGGETPSKSDEPSKSKELKELLAHQTEITEWLDKINNRVFELEDKYLVETLHGNIIKGWEADGKLLPKVNKVVEDKDRLFTYSSVNAWASYPVFKEKRQLKVENKQRKHVKRTTPSLSEKYSRKHGLGHTSSSGLSTDKYSEFLDDDHDYC